jgi:hypothetical protein
MVFWVNHDFILKQLNFKTNLSRENSLELIELSSVNKDRLV